MKWWAAVAVAAAIFAGALELGAARGLNDAFKQTPQSGTEAAAQRLERDRAISQSKGPFFLLAGSTQTVASQAAASDDRAWRASALLDASRKAASTHNNLEALAFLREVLAGGPSQSRTASLGLIGDYLVAAATDLRAQGRAADAVALLDEGFAAKQITTQQTQTALALDLSDAANLALKALAYQEALPQLQRLIAQYPAAPQSGVARQALAATHPIIGTLVHRDGSVSAAELRLATHFRLLPSGYVTTGPFYPGSPDANGDFTFSNVPQGGPYTLEVLSSTGWTTNVDPATNQPIDTVTASPLTVADMGFVVAPS